MISRDSKPPEIRTAFLVIAPGSFLMVHVRVMTCRRTRRSLIHRSSQVLTAPLPIEETFIREAAELQWLAGVILGGEQHVEECIRDAVRLAQNGGHVSPEWLTAWIQRVTARAAIERVRSQVRRCIENRPHPAGVSAMVPSLGAVDKRALRAVAIDRISADCDALERAALLLHVYLGFAAQDCALLLGCHRSAIVSACSSALTAILHESAADEAETGGIACEA